MHRVSKLPSASFFSLAVCMGCSGANDPKTGPATGAEKPSVQAATTAKSSAAKTDAVAPTGFATELDLSKPGVSPRSLKPAADLKTPEGLASPMIETKAAKSAWTAYANAHAGDFAEYEISGGSSSRMEIFDLADHAVVRLDVIKFKVAGNETASRSAIKTLFTEPDAETPTAAANFKSETKPSDRKVQVAGEEIAADSLTESSVDGKLVSRSWTSKSIPLFGTLITEDGEGNVSSKLVKFGSAK